MRSIGQIAKRLRFLSIALLGTAAGSVLAQPATFFDAGSFAAPSEPSSSQQYVGNVENAFDPFVGETVTVKWVRFELLAPIVGDLFLDIDTRITSITPDPSTKDPLLALYDGVGNLVAVDDIDGSFPQGIAAGLSFGSAGFRNPPDTPALEGQDGTLPAGVYWLAVVAGPVNLTSIGVTNWDMTTTGSFPVRFDPFDLFDLSFSIGNTTPLPPPINDECQNALVVGEGASRDTPVWEGTNAGALNNASTPCYSFPGPSIQPRDIWFSYVPSQTGKAFIEVSGGAGGAATPIITRYSGCGGSALRCTGGGSIVFDDIIYFVVDTVANEPILLSLSIRTGQTGEMALFINLIPDACPLPVPANAIQEADACGIDSNGGCNLAPPAFDNAVLGQTLTGTFYSTLSLRDTDWYEFTLAERRTVSATLQAQLPSAVVLQPVPTDACFAAELLVVRNGDYFNNPCAPVSGSVELDAGTYRMVVVPATFDGFSCDTGYNQWIVSTTSSPVGTGCNSIDFNRDGLFPDDNDLIDFLAVYAGGTCSTGTCDDIDFNNDELFPDDNDIITFLRVRAGGDCE